MNIILNNGKQKNGGFIKLWNFEPPTQTQTHTPSGMWQNMSVYTHRGFQRWSFEVVTLVNG